MLKLLIGGSPCTFWSIAQKNNRETEPSGIGWELFVNYLIAKEKFKPNVFLYENNKSAAQPIKDEIKKRLNVWGGNLQNEDSGARYIEINSALVSAQNRQRFYVHNCGEVEQPADRGIFLRDVLEMVTSEISYCLAQGIGNGDGKSYALTTRCNGAIVKDTIEKHRHTMVAEPINPIQSSKSRCVTAGYSNKGVSHILESYNSDNPHKQTFDSIAEPVIIQTPRGKNNGGAKYEKAPTMTSSAWQENNKVLEPIRIGDIGSQSQAHRVYSCDGKSVTLSAGGGGQGGKTGLYTCPLKPAKTNLPIYEVKDGQINLKGKLYPIKLQDGFYIIRKLTPTECERLQTLPDGYTKAVSNAQRYKGLGNGWTAEVIIHILQNALKDIPKNEEIVVLSMYDGIGTGRYCLDKMGFKNVKYFAYEIDKYAMQVANSNYPDIIQCGDAFQIRDEEWTSAFSRKLQNVM